MVIPLLAEQRRAAQQQLSEAVFDYFDAGAGEEVTARRAAEAWHAYDLLPRVLVDVGAAEVSTSLLGTPLPSPVALAPAAFQGIAHPDGELAVARACGPTGALFVLSTRCSHRIEDVAAAASGPWWFQVYVMRDRSLTEALVRRAVAAGASALVLTGDTPVVGRKPRVAGVRLDVPDDAYLVNVREHLGPGVDRAAAEQDPTITPDVIGWLHQLSGLPVLVKGVLRADDAERCLDAGAAGVVVSNHGGRQLDRSRPSALALPAVVDAVAGRGPVLVDGGLGSGLDCLVALALGADAVLLGRPVVWALAADGEAGVTRLLETVVDDLRHVMAVAGAPSVRALDRSYLAPRPT